MSSRIPEAGTEPHPDPDPNLRVDADADNDVAGLFVAAPNGLCMDFEDLAEEVSFDILYTNYRTWPSSADIASTKKSSPLKCSCLVHIALGKARTNICIHRLILHVHMQMSFIDNSSDFRGCGSSGDEPGKPRQCVCVCE